MTHKICTTLPNNLDPGLYVAEEAFQLTNRNVIKLEHSKITHMAPMFRLDEADAKVKALRSSTYASLGIALVLGVALIVVTRRKV